MIIFSNQKTSKLTKCPSGKKLVYDHKKSGPTPDPSLSRWGIVTKGALIPQIPEANGKLLPCSQ